MKSDWESKYISTLSQSGGTHLYEVLVAEIVRLVTVCKGFFEIFAAETPWRIGDGNLFLVMV